ncbi:DUF4232 domain-containing protein [Actinacidiphila paucisporea]|uniref:DUF4232 domain-containing protein n=1 Tax=Actinacidiphila paucisporea TaxID=310782 RepID=A0A1M7MVZ3_9ACTN|nr:DUF4232 domain-containing protein [Actinacidiphila paucisporea]SHM95328.1 Protein of unknown function [Actinacidiphila paucisporea]
MRTSLAAPAAALTGVLLLTACGSEAPGQPADARPGSTSGARCGFPHDPAARTSGGVEITGVSGAALGCGTGTPSDPPKVGFLVSNHEGRPLTYTVEFTLYDASGGPLTNGGATVVNVAPGRTARGSADFGEVLRNAEGGHVGIAKVRSVPADETPVASGTCPPSGVHVTADQGDAAMGLRVVGLHLRNCSAGPYRVSGFPQIQLQDLAHEPVTGVRVLHGSGGISTGTDFDVPPHPFTLQPGQSATSGLMWRNTVTDGTNVDVPYVRVVAQPGTHAVTVTPELDLGTTGKLGVGPWAKDDSGR